MLLIIQITHRSVSGIKMYQVKGDNMTISLLHLNGMELR